MEYKLDSRFPRTNEQKIKKERGTPAPITLSVFGGENEEGQKMIGMDLSEFLKIIATMKPEDFKGKLYIPARDLVTVVLAEDLL